MNLEVRKFQNNQELEKMKRRYLEIKVWNDWKISVNIYNKVDDYLISSVMGNKLLFWIHRYNFGADLFNEFVQS